MTILGQCFGRKRAMLWPFLQYLCFWMPDMAHIFTEESGMPKWILWNCMEIFCNLGGNLRPLVLFILAVKLDFHLSFDNIDYQTNKLHRVHCTHLIHGQLIRERERTRAIHGLELIDL